MKRKSRDLLWHDTNEGEIRVMVAFVVLQGIVNKPHVNDYHSINPLLHTPIFGKFMSRYRFLLLLKYLHFSDQDENPDPFRKVRPLFNLFVSKFQENYKPEKNIALMSLSYFGRGETEVETIHSIEKGKIWDRVFCTC